MELYPRGWPGCTMSVDHADDSPVINWWSRRLQNPEARCIQAPSVPFGPWGFRWNQLSAAIDAARSARSECGSRTGCDVRVRVRVPGDAPAALR
jgi:hypothetical protein